MTQLRATEDDRDFGHIPHNVFGVIDPLLPEMIGRIVMLAALLEHKVACIASAVGNEPQDFYFAQNFTQNRDTWESRSPLFNLNVSEDKIVERCGRFIAEVEVVLKARNDIVHRVWPVAGSSRWGGYKSFIKRRTRRRRTREAASDWADHTPATMQLIIDSLISMVGQSGDVVGLATSLTRR